MAFRTVLVNGACYIPVNLALDLIEQVPLPADFEAMAMARCLCCSLAWMQSMVAVQFQNDIPINDGDPDQKIETAPLLRLPEYALFLPARGDLTLHGYPIVGTFAFIDDRPYFPELNLVALAADMQIDMTRVFPLFYSCALVVGDTYARGVERACAAWVDPIRAGSVEEEFAQRIMAHFVARIAGDLTLISRNNWLRKPPATGAYDLTGDPQRFFMFRAGGYARTHSRGRS